MALETNRHATDETLERYTMDRLTGPEKDQFDDQLLVCARCQDALAESDLAMGRFRRAHFAVPRQEHRPLLGLLKPAWALGLAGVAFILLVAAQRIWTSHSAMPPAVVVLQSTRGGQTALNSTAAARRPLNLKLDLTDLEPLSRYELAIVDAGGRSVFHSSTTANNGAAALTLPSGLSAGMYYVRLSGPDQELLREYGLKVLD